MRRRRGIRMLMAVLGGAGALVVTGTAVAAPGECPEIMPTSDLTTGAVGEGWTVSQGTTAEPFTGEVLGVLPDAIAPGRDMIIVEATSPAVDSAGGIWAGMSGSPFYVDDKLVGVVAFGLTLGPSPIAGLTPAEEIRRVHQYPISSLASAPAKVTLPRALARKVARRAAVTTRQASTFVRLKVPVSVSGVPARGFKRLNAMARRTGAKILGYNGASASSVLPGDPSEIVPGGNFAAALSYGDVTIAGVGTTSYVCDERAVAFGHPFFFTGATSAAASVADALTIVTGDLFGPFKLATVGGPVGILDQDRLGGVRTLLGLTPGTTPIQSRFTSLDTGRERAGQTDAVVDDFLADLTFLHTLGNVDSVLDAIGKGSARLEWTITGSDEDGDPWSLARQDILASEWDISFDASVQLADEVFAIGQFQDEGVTVDGIEISGDVEQTLKLLRIKKVLVKRAGKFVPLGSEITARPGQLVKFEVVLRSIPGAPDRLVHLRVRMPDNFRHAVIEIAGGPTEEFCEDEFCEGPETFAELLDDLRTKRQHNDLAATVFSGRNFVARDVDTRRFDRAVQGQRTVFVSRAGGAVGAG
jgi:SpoIVB peptidase S55